MVAKAEDLQTGDGGRWMNAVWKSFYDTTTAPTLCAQPPQKWLAPAP